MCNYDQNIYCSDKGDGGKEFFLTEDSSGAELENNDAQKLTTTETLRAALGEGGSGSLLVVGSLGNHRNVNGIKKSSVASLLSVYPDVLKVGSNGEHLVVQPLHVLFLFMSCESCLPTGSERAKWTNFSLCSGYNE